MTEDLVENETLPFVWGEHWELSIEVSKKVVYFFTRKRKVREVNRLM